MASSAYRRYLLPDIAPARTDGRWWIFTIDRRGTMRTKTVHTGLLLGLIAATVAGCSSENSADQPGALSPTRLIEASPEAAQHFTVAISTHPSQGPVRGVPGAEASLVTNDAGAHVRLTTSGLPPGHPHTVWFVAINDPDQCSARPCTPVDILVNSAAVKSEVTFAAGNIVGGEGTATFAGTVRAGTVRGGWFGNGLTNPRGAEIHLIVQDHGPKIAGLVGNQLSTVRGGCTDASLPVLYPPAAFADGIPGPNTCRLRQFAIFQQ
jgi:hypothetical protein